MSTARVHRLCADSDRADPAVRYLYSAYLPSEDTCFCLFQAASSDEVLAVNRQARFALDRVTEATLLVSLDTEPGHPPPSPFLSNNPSVEAAALRRPS